MRLRNDPCAGPHLVVRSARVSQACAVLDEFPQQWEVALLNSHETGHAPVGKRRVEITTLLRVIDDRRYVPLAERDEEVERCGPLLPLCLLGGHKFSPRAPLDAAR